jgi:hypothetical protein
MSDPLGMVPRTADGIPGRSLKFRLPEGVVTLAQLEGESVWAGGGMSVGAGVGAKVPAGRSDVN